MSLKRNIFLVGPMGAGKTTIGRQIAKMLGKTFFDSDALVEEKSGVDISWIFDVEGEDGFRAREKKVLADITQEQDIVLATGGGAIVDDENRDVLSARGVVVYLRASLDQQYQRTKNDTRRPTLQTDDLESKLQELHAEREPLYSEIADVIVDTGTSSIRSVTEDIIGQLNPSLGTGAEDGFA